MRSPKLVRFFGVRFLGVRFLGVGLCVGVVGSATRAEAQSAAVQPYPAVCSTVASSESDRGYVLYQAGKAYYDDANYDAAIQQFREAYKKDCTKHDLLIIISRAYELKTDRAAAVDALEEYLRRVPNAPEAPSHKNRIENLRKQMAASAHAAVAAVPAAPPPEVREHTVLPWVVASVGGVAAITGVVFLLAAPAIPSTCSADTSSCQPPDPPGSGGSRTPEVVEKDKSTGDKHRLYSAIGLGCTLGGLGLAGAGLLWHVLEPTGPVERSGRSVPKVAPQVAPGFAGLSVGGAF